MSNSTISKYNQLPSMSKRSLSIHGPDDVCILNDWRDGTRITDYISNACITQVALIEIGLNRYLSEFTNTIYSYVYGKSICRLPGSLDARFRERLSSRRGDITVHAEDAGRQTNTNGWGISVCRKLSNPWHRNCRAPPQIYYWIQTFLTFSNLNALLGKSIENQTG